MISISQFRPAVQVSVNAGSPAQVFVTSQSTPAIVIVGSGGIRGEKGEKGDSAAAASAIASETISASKAVRLRADGKLELAQPDGVPVLGIALTSASADQQCEYRTIGAIEDAGNPWTAGSQFLSANGTLTHIPPSSGFLVRIGYAPASSLLEINISQPLEIL